ncbi:sensor histidine kinase [Actinomadura craniellae]|uniref:Sensor histidine kinase n=1 Tax=Actinomadura craniellae TaxID=2231787 RepID=A0A365H3W0_9ACTN|nr:ATP-binding protein [Actinomadura craniellae]RAY13672.1 sensor histidine kinase [Actinomadura craniellae]
MRRRPPTWFGARSRLALAVGVAVSLAALGCGWPYWRAEPPAALVALPSCGGFALAGGLLVAGRRGRRTGALFLVAAVAWAATWSASWNTGPLPLTSVFAQSAFFFAIVTGALLYPSDRLERTAERVFVGAAALTLFGGQLALCLVSRPEWNGFAPAAFWPAPLADQVLFGRVHRVLLAALAVLAGTLVILLVRRLPRGRRPERRFAVPVLAAVTTMVVAGLASQGSLVDTGIRLDDVLRVYVVQGLAAVALPLAFLATGLRRSLAELAAAERMLRLTAPVSIEKIRDALRDVLHDDTLDLWFWVPQDAGYVDAAGRAVDLPGSPAPGRRRRQVDTEDGALLAVVEVDAALTGHPSLLDAALAAGGRALETAQLQATAQAHLERARAAGERLVRVQTAERERLAGDLRRSTQHHLRELDAMLELLESAATDPTARDQARACRGELAEAVAEIGQLARGVHPAILTNGGLRPALETVAGRAGASADLPDRRFPPEIESTLFFALCEALANAVKHARATDIRLSVRAEPGRVLAEVRDDGTGLARPGQGEGGLAGVIDRVRALRGDVTVESVPGEGTTVRISVPCD